MAAAPRRVEIEVEEDMDDEELAVVDALLASQEETIRQQRLCIAAQKEKIRLMHQLADRREDELSEATQKEALVEELRGEAARLRSMNRRLAERQAQQQDILDGEWGVGSVPPAAAPAPVADDDCKMAASDCEDRPSKKARFEE